MKRLRRKPFLPERRGYLEFRGSAEHASIDHYVLKVAQPQAHRTLRGQVRDTDFFGIMDHKSKS